MLCMALLSRLLLGVDEPLPLLSAKAHHLVPALAVGLVPHPLHLRLHPRLPKAVSIYIAPRTGYTHTWRYTTLLSDGLPNADT